MRLRITMAVESDDGQQVIKSATAYITHYENRQPSSTSAISKVWVDETLKQLRKEVLKRDD